MEQGYGGSYGSWVQCSECRRFPGKPPLRGPQGRGPRLSPVPAARSSGEADRARARRSLDCGAVAPATLRADWMAVPEEAGGVRRPDAGMGFRGRLGPSDRFLTLSLGGSNRLAHRARAHPPADFPFGRRHKMAAPGGGATLRARGAQESSPWRSGLSRDPRGLVGAAARRTWPGARVPECAWVARGRSLPCQLRGVARPRRVRLL